MAHLLSVHLLICKLSQERGYHILISLAIGIIGLILTVTISSSTGKYVGLCILLFGCYVPAPLTVAWLSGNTPGMFLIYENSNTFLFM